MKMLRCAFAKKTTAMITRATKIRVHQCPTHPQLLKVYTAVQHCREIKTTCCILQEAMCATMALKTITIPAIRRWSRRNNASTTRSCVLSSLRQRKITNTGPAGTAATILSTAGQAVIRASHIAITDIAITTPSSVCARYLMNSRNKICL